MSFVFHLGGLGQMNNHSIYPYNYDQFNPVKTYFNAHVFITALGVKEFTATSVVGFCKRAALNHIVDTKVL